MASYRIIVSGKVQGVYYRKTIAQKALALATGQPLIKAKDDQ